MDEKTILLVEDNPDDIELTLRAFKRSGVANPITIARDGVEALERLGIAAAPAGGELPRLPAVILLDLKLPKVDGLELLRRIRGAERTRLVPVVILTSSREERDMVSGYRLGANSYIRKPISFNEFTEAVQQLGMYWLLLNEPPPVK